MKQLATSMFAIWFTGLFMIPVLPEVAHAGPDTPPQNKYAKRKRSFKGPVKRLFRRSSSSALPRISSPTNKAATTAQNSSAPKVKELQEVIKLLRSNKPIDPHGLSDLQKKYGASKRQAKRREETKQTPIAAQNLKKQSTRKARTPDALGDKNPLTLFSIPYTELQSSTIEPPNKLAKMLGLGSRPDLTLMAAHRGISEVDQYMAVLNRIDGIKVK